MAISFKHYYKSGSLIGTGAVKFRPYTVASPLPQLATPQNVTADGTTVSWDAVENATSYDILADGVSIGEYVPAPSGFSITVEVTNGTYAGDTTITNNATITITADSGYKLPDTVTVTGASQTWNKETGTLTLTNPTGAVTVSAVCAAAVKYYVIASTPYVYYATINGVNLDFSDYPDNKIPLKNGDVVKFVRDTDSFTINGTAYKGEYSNPINVVNSNITVESCEYYDYGVDVTFNFSET